MDERTLQSFDEWLEGKAYDIKPDHWIVGGSSQIPLAVIRRSTPRNDKVILKFFKDSERVRRWEEAASDCPEDFKSHIAQLKDPSMLGGSGLWIGLLDIGGGDISKFRPLTELIQPSRGPDLASACQIIIDSITRKWNSYSPEDSVREVPVSQYCKHVFNSPGKTLHQLLLGQSVDETAKLIQRDFMPDEELPNPLTFIDKLRKSTLYGRYGRAHRDLHAGNILLSIDPFAPETYKLIDLENFSPMAPLACDPMILLSSIAKIWLKEVSVGSESSHRLIKVIVDGSPDDSLSSTYYQVSSKIHTTGYHWEMDSGAGDDWRCQSLLSLVACGLRYASRPHKDNKNPVAVRAWYFDLAAFAARRYLEETDQWKEFRKGSTSKPVTSTPEFSNPAPPSTNDDDNSEMAAESKHAEAIIIHFPPPQGSTTREDLAKELRVLNLDDTDWHIRSAKTEKLRKLLPGQIQACTDSDGLLRSLLSDLDDALRTAISQLSTNQDRYSAINEIERITPWILDLIAR